MEALCLLYSVTSTFIKSSFLSLALALQSLPSLLFSCVSASPPPDPPEEVCAVDPPVRLYEGRVRHVRRRPVAHSFEYFVRYALIDLDRFPQLPSHHLSAAHAREIAATTGPVYLLTIPASVGYEQNPLSVYYCYDAGSVKLGIAEVTNTPWGERVRFLFNPKSDLVAKPLHVSPFMDMLGNWNIRADPPGEGLFISISVQHPTLGNYFTATLKATRVHASSKSVNHAMYFWLMPHKVAIWIYWQALKLYWKKVAFMQHPRYTNPRYKEDALLRDQKLCRGFRTGENGRSNVDDFDCACDRSRWCIWKEADWPWS